MSEIDQVVGKRLKDARERSGIAVRDLAVSLNMEPSHLEAIEGGNARPEGQSLVQHARLLGLSLPELFSGFEPILDAHPADPAAHNARERLLIGLLYEHAEQTSPEMRSKLLTLADELSHSGTNAELIEHINLKISQISAGRPPKA
jgi:transcriptional regulator with XRE-family HTH domain